MNNNEDLNTKIWANLPDDVHTYFFRKVFAGDRGVKQELVIEFFNALHRHCLTLGIKPEWDPESGKRIRLLVKNIKFDEPKPSRPPRARRTSRSPSKSTSKPAPSGNDPGSAHRTGEETPLPRGERPDPNSQT